MSDSKRLSDKPNKAPPNNKPVIDIIVNIIILFVLISVFIYLLPSSRPGSDEGLRGPEARRPVLRLHVRWPVRLPEVPHGHLAHLRALDAVRKALPAAQAGTLASSEILVAIR